MINLIRGLNNSRTRPDLIYKDSTDGTLWAMCEPSHRGVAMTEKVYWELCLVSRNFWGSWVVDEHVVRYYTPGDPTTLQVYENE
jgi:hypothetical protein